MATRRQKRRKILLGGAASVPFMVLLALSLTWLVAPLYVTAVLTVRLLAWPTTCRAYRSWPAVDHICEALVTGTATGCGSHREKKARDLQAALSPWHERSLLQTARRFVSRHPTTPEPLPNLSGAPVRVTFENALSIYAIFLCAAAVLVGILAHFLIG
ncbi:conserved hypothetical protein [Frankia canadensis]|uniref:Uncharacterized protein n=1 Tax=Frankia canadensis TaxID=1836972 RepID=A0A2I2L172_9ACTN|nr:hypothetical protein [Frankia canadensis]SNQ51676.1 conserved hypothetical protein [Frankia canadensis]SOU58966.1 conserved hypothetical protein [Frankia canadensis]